MFDLKQLLQQKWVIVAVVVVVLAAVWFLVRPKPAPAPIVGGVARESMKMMAPGAAPMAANKSMMEDSGEEAPAEEESGLQTPKIIKSADLALVVDSVKDAMKKAEQIAVSLGGYATYSKLERSDEDYVSGQSILKVPGPKFDLALEKFEGLGRVSSRDLRAEDVSEQYMDLDSRLRNLKKQEDALLVLFNRSGKVTEILEIERELARVRTESEQIQGRLKVMKNQISFSTINLTFYQVRTAIPESATSFGSIVKEAISSALTSLAGLAAALLTGLVWLVIFIPVILVVLILLWLAVYLVRKRTTKPEA